MPNTSKATVYLGDGLYANCQYGTFQLSTDRMGVTHWVALEPEVLNAFFRYIERVTGGKLVFTPPPLKEGAPQL